MDRDRLLNWIRAGYHGDLAAELHDHRREIASGDNTPARLRRAAWLTAACGDAVGAEALLHRARADFGDRGEAWFAIGLLHLAHDDHERARNAFLAAARSHYPAGQERTRKRSELRSYDPAENRFAVFGIFYDVFQDDFCCFALVRKVRRAEHQTYEFCVARACAFLGHSAATASLLEADRALNGETLWYHVNLGHYRWLADDREEADRHFRRAREIAVRDRLTPYHFNRGALVWLNHTEATSLLTAPSPPDHALVKGWEHHFGESPEYPTKITIVVGCDTVYFQFFPKFLLSVLRAHTASGEGISMAVHCHLADPAPAQIALLERIGAELRTRYPLLKLSYGLSHSTFRKPSYYTCLRFLALPAVLDFYGCGALILDVDSEVEPTLFAKHAQIAQFDVGLRMYSFDPRTGLQVGAEPWSIGAHPAYISTTPIARRFAAFLGAYIDAAYDPSLATNWTIDQCAIARGYDLILRPAPEASVLNFAAFDPISRLPSGSKADFLLEDGGVGPDTFWDRAAAYLA